MKCHRVRIEWKSVTQGGRAAPFVGMRYSTVARFPGDALPWESASAWSVVVEFDEATRSDSGDLGTVRFLSENAPHDLLKAGTVFELYEGPRLTAVGTVLNEGS